MYKTPNFAMHRWDGTDNWLMSEVNENFTTIDTLMKEYEEIVKTVNADQVTKNQTAIRNNELLLWMGV